MSEMHKSWVLVARIAVAEKMVSQEIMDRVLEAKAANPSGLPVGELLVQYGHINGHKFNELMALVRAARPTEDSIVEAELFGETVVAKKLATPEQVGACLREQAELAAKGTFKNLGELLVERGIVTAEQVKELLGEHDQAIMVCPACREQYNVLKVWQGRSRCPADGEVLKAAAHDTAVGVAATLAEVAEDSPIGMEAGGCRIVELIARGSMGAVYKAKHLGLNRYVAVKMLPSVSQDPEMVKRLLFEARAVAKLEHPNIVQVYDVGFQRGYFFIVMQLLKGQTLEERQGELKVIPVAQALEIVRDVAEGLGAAHSGGIIHRDLKPANIMLTEDGKARLTDFGLAQDTENPEEKPGIIVGTPFYMSPEQWLGHKADERSDLYALGIILYQMVTGRRPFDGTNVHELMNHHLKSPPPSPQKYNPDLTSGLTAVIKKLIVKAPQKRYPNAPEFLKDLRKVMAGEDPGAMDQFGTLVKCRFCEHFNPMRETKCKVCGESLHSEGGPLEIVAREDEFKCPGCGAINTKGSRACSGCRKPFCSRCRQRLVVLRGFCHQCMPHLRRPGGRA